MSRLALEMSRLARNRHRSELRCHELKRRLRARAGSARSGAIKLQNLYQTLLLQEFAIARVLTTRSHHQRPLRSWLPAPARVKTKCEELQDWAAMPMRASAVAGLLCALPCAHGAGNATFVLGPQIVLHKLRRPQSETHGYGHAADFCTYIGATIATIHSAAENELARQACGLESCWLGLVYGPTWLWQNPPASQTTAPAYTNWAAGEPANPGASAHAVMMSGEWYAAAADDSAPYPLCRAEGELNFTLDHQKTQCRERCRPTQGQNKDKNCCAHPRKMSCADDATGGGYQLVRFGSKKDKDDACDRYHRRSAYSYGCYPRERRRNQNFNRVRSTAWRFISPQVQTRDDLRQRPGRRQEGLP